MRFSLTDEQALLEDSAQTLLAKANAPGQRAYGSAGDAATPRLWRAFAEMGWLGLPLAEADGGFGGGALDIGLLMRAFGRHGANAPFHGAMLLAARLLAALGSAAQREAWLPAAIDGSKRLALAHDEAGAPDPWCARTTRAVREGAGWRLHGAKALVAGAPGADALLVSARLEGGPGSGHGLFLLPVAAATPDGLRLRPCRLADGALAADVDLDDVAVGADACLGGNASDTGAVLARVLAEGTVALCWEACGAMQAALELTVAYARQREQFGRPLAAFQVVQHRLAEMAVCCEEAQAACELAALRLDSGWLDRDGVQAAASLAKSTVGRAARFVAQEAVQLHGAMGVSEELPVAALFRKLTQFQQQAGATAWHSARLGALQWAGGGWRASQALPLPPSYACQGVAA